MSKFFMYVDRGSMGVSEALRDVVEPKYSIEELTTEEGQELEKVLGSKGLSFMPQTLLSYTNLTIEQIRFIARKLNEGEYSVIVFNDKYENILDMVGWRERKVMGMRS